MVKVALLFKEEAVRMILACFICWAGSESLLLFLPIKADHRLRYFVTFVYLFNFLIHPALFFLEWLIEPQLASEIQKLRSPLLFAAILWRHYHHVLASIVAAPDRSILRTHEIVEVWLLGCLILRIVQLDG